MQSKESLTLALSHLRGEGEYTLIGREPALKDIPSLLERERVRVKGCFPIEA